MRTGKENSTFGPRKMWEESVYLAGLELRGCPEGPRVFVPTDRCCDLEVLLEFGENALCLFNNEAFPLYRVYRGEPSHRRAAEKPLENPARIGASPARTGSGPETRRGQIRCRGARKSRVNPESPMGLLKGECT